MLLLFRSGWRDVEACCDCLKFVLDFGLKPFASYIQVNTRMCEYCTAVGVFQVS